MKHWYLTFITFLLAASGWAQSPPPAGLRIISRELPTVDGVLTFDVTAMAQAAGQADYSVRVAAPGLPLRGNTAGRSYAAFSQSVQPGDTLRTTLTVEYDTGRLPFSLEKLDVQLVDRAGQLIASAPAFVFFTPYQTVELWSRTDLDNLNRVWDVPNTSTVPARPYIYKEQIPLSDLTDEELADPEVPKKLKSIRGLAYSIPMKDVGRTRRKARKTWKTPGSAAHWPVIRGAPPFLAGPSQSNGTDNQPTCRPLFRSP